MLTSNRKIAFIPALFLLTACAITPSAQTIQPPVPKTLAAQFCNASQHGDIDAFLKLATPSLAAVVTEAEAKNKIIADRHPDEKPPLGDGIPLRAYSDFAPVCHGGAVIMADGQVLQAIDHNFTTKREASAGWSDRLVLARGTKNWKIDNILYGPHYTDDLRKTLQSVFPKD